MRVLAVDVGTKRTGIAVSDPLGYTAQPLETWQCRTPVEDAGHIAQLATYYQAELVLVGHPITLGGSASPQTVKAEAFAATLQERCTCPVRLWDERLTTAQGERALIEGGVRREKRRHVVDQVAAQLLLQQYLDAQRGKA